MERSLHFDSIAEVYERARPPYPDALWARLRELGALRSGSRALDLGAGTGQATGPLLRAGLDVTAVEPGPELASRLRANHPQATVIVARGEDAILPEANFDLAVAATSIHWMNLDLLLPRLHRSLVSEGWLAVWRTVYGDPNVRTPFRHRVDAIVGRRPDSTSAEHLSTAAHELDTDLLAEQLVAGGYFEVHSTDLFSWSTTLDSIQVRDLFTSFSNWTLAEADEAAKAAAELGGTVEEHYLTPIVVLRRLP